MTAVASYEAPSLATEPEGEAWTKTLHPFFWPSGSSGQQALACPSDLKIVEKQE